MKTPITIYVEIEDVVKFRELHLNAQEVCREAIKEAIEEVEKVEKQGTVKHYKDKDVLQKISKVATEEEKLQLIKILKKPYQDLTDEDIKFLDSINDEVDKKYGVIKNEH